MPTGNKLIAAIAETPSEAKDFAPAEKNKEAQFEPPKTPPSTSPKESKEVKDTGNDEAQLQPKESAPTPDEGLLSVLAISPSGLESKETKVLAAGINSSTPVEHQLTEKEKFWKEKYFPGMFTAIKCKELAVLQFFLGPELYLLKQDYNQTLRDQRFDWLKSSSKSSFYSAASDMTVWFEEKLYHDAILKEYEQQVIKPLRNNIESFSKEEKHGKTMLTNSQNDIAAYELVCKQYQEILDAYQQEGLKAYHQKLAPLKKALGEYIRFLNPAPIVRAKKLILSVGEVNEFHAQIKKRFKEVRNHLLDDFVQALRLETTTLLQMANEGITRADLEDRYEEPTLIAYQQLLTTVVEVFNDSDAYKRFSKNPDLIQFRQTLVDATKECTKDVVALHEKRKKLKEEYQAKKDDAIRKYKEWVANVLIEMVKRKPDILPLLYRKEKLSDTITYIEIMRDEIIACDIGSTPLQRFRNRDWNTLIHIALNFFLQADLQNQRKMKPLLELLIKHGCSPCTRNHVKQSSSDNAEEYAKQNAFEYALSGLPSAEQREQLFPDWWLLEVTLRCMATYSPAEEEIRQVLLNFCIYVESNLSPAMASKFLGKLILMVGKQSVAEITNSLYDARTEGCDEIVFAAIWKMLRDQQSEVLKQTPLYKGLKRIMERVENHELTYLPTPEREIFKAKMQRMGDELQQMREQLKKERDDNEKQKVAHAKEAEKNEKKDAEREKRCVDLAKINAELKKDNQDTKNTVAILTHILAGKVEFSPAERQALGMPLSSVQETEPKQSSGAAFFKMA